MEQKTEKIQEEINKDLSFHLGEARENLDSIVLLCNLSEAGIENSLIKDPWELYLIFDILKFLSAKSINNIKSIKY